jgi:hypothetical protein
LALEELAEVPTIKDPSEEPLFLTPSPLLGEAEEAAMAVLPLKVITVAQAGATADTTLERLV